MTYASVTSKLTPDSVVTYLLHDWARSLWLFCLVWHVRAMIKVCSTPRLTARRLSVLRVCAMFEGLTEFCFVFRSRFGSTLLDCSSAAVLLEIICWFLLYIVAVCQDSRLHQLCLSNHIILVLCTPLSNDDMYQFWGVFNITNVYYTDLGFICH